MKSRLETNRVTAQKCVVRRSACPSEQGVAPSIPNGWWRRFLLGAMFVAVFARGAVAQEHEKDLH